MNNAIIGIDDHLLFHLENSIKKAKRIRIIASFILESGAKLIARQLRNAADNNVPIKILTSKYMGITEPSAIYYLLDVLGHEVEINFYREELRSFHPKAYLFDSEDDSEIYVGSSNLSRSALTDGVEWNYRLTRSHSPESYDRFSETFETLFYKHSAPITEESLKEYAQSWKKPAIPWLETSYRHDTKEPEPIGAQIEALYELRRAREEGIERGLVIAATGVGKTYISAFDSKDYKRVLFVAHREEILKHAKDTFRRVRPRSRIATSINQKTLGSDIYFATIQTLSRSRHLTSYPHNYFDYLVIDEFHHAAADSYGKVLSHFRPKFLLGLTATPYRTDNRDIYVLCDDNVIYEIGLKEAIDRDLLSPFHYYGIYDSTDYSAIEIKSGKYVLEQLERELAREERAKLVYENYLKFRGPSKRAMAFCASINHAESMAEFFAERGVDAVVVHSGQKKSERFMGREEAINALKAGEIQLIFCVDIFNEGVDVPSLDMVMFLRPTESLTIFLQQLGRGLRKAEDKASLLVLDFIGNYKRAHYIPALLAGRNPMKETSGSAAPGPDDYPANCLVNFDFNLLDLFETMAKSDPLKKRMRNEYFRVKELLGRRPSRMDVYDATDIPFREFLKGGWLRFLESVEDLRDEEKAWLDTPAEGFLMELEKTSMTKAYKMPTIGAFLAGDSGMLDKVHLSVIGQRFKAFYAGNRHYQKDLMDKSTKGWRDWKDEQFEKIAEKNPVHFLSKSKYFHYDQINKEFYLDDSLHEHLSDALATHIKDILRYRTVDYFSKRYKGEDA